ERLAEIGNGAIVVSFRLITSHGVCFLPRTAAHRLRDFAEYGSPRISAAACACRHRPDMDGDLSKTKSGTREGPSSEIFMPPRRHASSRQLIADRQPADALAGCPEDGVAERRCKGRQTRLAHAARWHVDAVFDDVRVGHRRRLIMPDDRVVVEVALLDAAV